jgi:hypothetical protein
VGAFLLTQKPRFPLQFTLSALISAAIACAGRGAKFPQEEKNRPERERLSAHYTDCHE